MTYRFNKNLIIECNKPKFPKEGWLLILIIILDLIWEYHLNA